MKPIIIATRGSALALAQANAVLAECRAAFPRLAFELNIIKTTGDKLQSASLANPDASLPKGLFTKELEVALLNGEADLAVHSLKDLPTELPPGLVLKAVCKRADVRDVLIYRDAEHVRAEAAKQQNAEWTPGQKVRLGFARKLKLAALPSGTVVATSSTRRRAILLAARPETKVVELRGNVPTRLAKLAERSDFDAILLAAAGLERLKFRITPTGSLAGDGVPAGLLAVRLEPEEMLPAVGQAAVGIEVRAGNDRVVPICAKLNHGNTHLCVRAERAFLRAMGGGCASPVAAYAELLGHQLRLRAVSFLDGTAKRGEASGKSQEPEQLGEQLAAELKARRAP
ncbi:MAG: hydroxymethylbilane synthase [Pedosphaera sp. Tous-C6FEB]|nr:MAG: hydroxymethylbilane synthase [Pedosphaera sp. Tous-C6FEB]